MRNAMLAGLQAALTVAICVPLFALSPWSHLVGYASLGALVALFGRFAPARARSGIVLECAFWQSFAVLTMSAATWLEWSSTAKLVFLALACSFYVVICLVRKLGAPGPLIFIFAVGASMTGTLSLSQVLERTAATAVVAACAWLICAATEKLRQPAGEEGLTFPSAPQLPTLDLFLMAVRVAVAALLVVFISDALGMSHPAWAAMGAVAVLQASQLHINMHRAVQRMAGTVLGAALAWVLLVQNPSIWSIVAVLVALQFLTEIVIGINYALGQVLITPMALLMTYLAAPTAAGTAMVAERVVDTVLGAIVGMLIAVLLSRMKERRTLALHHGSRAR